MRGAALRLEREEKLTAWASWHTAALGRAKKMPKLAEIMPRDRPKKAAKRPRQTWEDMLAVAKIWTRVLNRIEQDG